MTKKEEIGSDFWIENQHVKCSDIRTFTGLENYNPVFTLSGRTALDLIVDDILVNRFVDSVYLPSYCCHTMIEPFIKNNIRVEFYDVLVGENGLEYCYKDNDCDIVFLIDYFGYICPSIEEFAKDQRKIGKIVIYDTTHSLFSSNIRYANFDYIFASVRKWFAINGGFAVKNGDWNLCFELRVNKEYELMRNTAANLKCEYMSGRLSEDGKARYLELFSGAENLLETDYEKYKMTSESKIIMERTNYSALKKKRRENAEYLIEKLSDMNEIKLLYREIKDDEVPLFVPVIVSHNRDELRKRLISNKIYLPVHWPLSKYHTVSKSAENIYECELSLVCDQRYDIDDMQRICNYLKTDNNY